MESPNATPDTLRGARELKVQLPTRLYVRLRGMKVLTGQTIAGMVCEALDQYFDTPKQRAMEPALARMLPPEASAALARREGEAVTP